jgi:hypothetical protein
VSAWCFLPLEVGPERGRGDPDGFRFDKSELKIECFEAFRPN